VEVYLGIWRYISDGHNMVTNLDDGLVRALIAWTFWSSKPVWGRKKPRVGSTPTPSRHRKYQILCAIDMEER